MDSANSRGADSFTGKSRPPARRARANHECVEIADAGRGADSFAWRTPRAKGGSGTGGSCSRHVPRPVVRAEPMHMSANRGVHLGDQCEAGAGVFAADVSLFVA